MLRESLTLAVALTAAAAALSAPAASAEEWGSVKGRFVYDGKAPDKVPITVDKDQAVCGDKGLMAEDLVVDDKGGLANVMIYLKGKVSVHPDFEKTAGDTVVLDNHGCRFEPHVQGVRVGQTLQLKNSDPVAHNTNVAGRNLQINPLIPAGASSDQKIEDAETLPAMVSCNIHPWMKARLLIKANPYFAVSKKDGTFEITNLPVGEHEFVVYQERSGYVQQATLNGEKVNWPKGVVKLTVKETKPDAPTDLGDIKLSPEQFNK
jgi:hypothetical protein